MEAVGKLYGGRVPQICARACGNTSATCTTTLQRINAAIEGIREMLTTAIQVNLAHDRHLATTR